MAVAHVINGIIDWYDVTLILRAAADDDAAQHPVFSPTVGQLREDGTATLSLGRDRWGGNGDAFARCRHVGCIVIG